MKKFKFYLSFLAVFALLFTSCSKEENSGMNDDSSKATLSFGAIVEDLAGKSADKQSVGDLPECTDDTPAYVEIVLMQGGSPVVGSIADPYRVDLVAGQIFTEEDAALELEPGNYSLEHFSVYNAEGDVIWLAPKGGVLAEFVDSPLPLSINLGAGVKKYVDVSVICYDDRDVNQYGYLFFELDTNEAFEFCFFANYCTPEGRHFPARYSVNISIDGTSLYNGVVNDTGRDNNGDLFAEAVCFALPNLDAYEDNEEYIDYTLTLLDWTEEDDAYGDIDPIVISGSLSRAEIMANFVGADDVEYEHVRFGCGDDGGTDVDSDNDGVPNDSDECPNEAGPISNDGCPVDETDADNDGVVDGEDDCPDTPSGATVDANGCPSDTDGDGIYNGIDVCPNENPEVDENNDGCEDETGVDGCEIGAPAAGCSIAWLEGSESFFQFDDADTPMLLEVDGNVVGTVRVTIDESGAVVVGTVLTASSALEFTSYEVWVSNSASGSVVASACDDIDDSTLTDELAIELGDIDASYPYFVRVKANVCPVVE